MEILNIVLPVFLVIGLGYALRVTGFLRTDTAAALAKLVFHVAAPALLFRSAALTPVARSVSIDILLLLTGVTVAFSLAIYLGCARCAPSRRGVLAQGVHRSNMVFVGLPIVVNAYGTEILGPVAVMIGFMVMLYNLLAVLLLTLPHQGRSARSAAVWGGTALKIVRNPLILGSGLGIVASLIGLALPSSIDQALELVGRTALPIALIAVGAGLEPDRLRVEIVPAMLVSAGKLIVYPALVLLGLTIMGKSGLDLEIPVLIMASPTAVVSYIMAKEMNGDERLAGAIVIGSTLASLLTVSGWLVLFRFG